MKYDLVIAYRIYPGISKIPPAYPNNKYKLAELCLKSFKNSLLGLKFKMYVLMDSCPKEYETLFRENFKTDEIEIIKLENYGNKRTFKKQIEILSAQNESDIVYFAEDDYFYIKNITNMVNFLKSKKADFVTPYEHPASYGGSVINNNIEIFGNQRYVTVQLACLTFMTTKEKLLENKRYFLIFSNWFGSDTVVWGCITFGFKYFKFLKTFLNFKKINTENFKVFGSMCFFAWHRFIFNRKYKLFMPIQTLATHMENDYLAPCIDWKKYFSDK